METITLERLTEEGNWVPEEIKLDLEEDFAISDDIEFEKYLCGVGRQLSFYANLGAELQAQAARYKADLESLYSEKAIQLRNSGDKVTENSIREKILSDTEYKILRGKHIIREKDAKKVDNFFRSQQKRADVLISIAYKKKVEYQKDGW